MPSFHRRALGTVTGISVLPANQKNGLLIYTGIPFNIVQPNRIRELLAGIDFNNPVDGVGLGARLDGFVYLKLKGGLVAKYLLLVDLGYLVREGDWGHMLPLSVSGRRRFRAEL